MKILAFEKQLGARLRIEKLACYNWCAVNMRRNPLMRFFDIAQLRNIQFDLSNFLEIDNDLIPDKYVLHQNYPNPFNPRTIIRYDLPKDSDVAIKIFDIMGREIVSLKNKFQKAGYQSIEWDATNNLGQPVSAGIYVYSIETKGFRKTKKMILLK